MFIHLLLTMLVDLSLYISMYEMYSFHKMFRLVEK